MTDLEITRLCAEAMGVDFGPELVAYTVGQQINNEQIMANRIAAYDPLHDDAQAMALVKRFGVTIIPVWDAHDGTVSYWRTTITNDSYSESFNLKRAICKCVAEQSEKVDA